MKSYTIAVPERTNKQLLRYSSDKTEESIERADYGPRKKRRIKL